MSSESEENLCVLHAEKLKLFCLDHQEPVCVVCRDSKDHSKHRFRPVNEASQDHKTKLRSLMRPLQEKLMVFVNAKGKCDEAAQHLQVQVQRSERQIHEQFQKLQQFLREEEEARICAVKEEEEKKAKMMKETTDGLSREITHLSETIRATEEELRASDVSFLQNYTAAVERVQRYPLQEDPPPVSGALIDEAKHLGNLSYSIWSRMKETVSFTPVILDPNTAHPELLLTEDLTGVQFGPKQKLPENPERFDHHLCVLGSVGFSSGTHSWDVAVRNDRSWGVGVVKESVLRKGQIQTGYWELALRKGTYIAVGPLRPNEVLPVKNLQRVRVLLDWDRKRLSFFDLGSNRLIHSFKESFNEKMFPYFGLESDQSLKILPMNTSVSEHHETHLSVGFWGT